MSGVIKDHEDMFMTAFQANMKEVLTEMQDLKDQASEKKMN